MAGKTKIEWTDSNWNPIRGCSRVSEGCRNCYAENITARFNKPGQWGEGLAEIVTRPDGAKKARWTGKMVQAPEATLTAPLRWKAPRMIFVNSTSDLFHEAVPDEWIDRVFAVMALCPQHTFQVLTKRPERMRDYFAETWQPAPARNINVLGQDHHIPAQERGDDRWDRINHAIDLVTFSRILDQDRFWDSNGDLIGRPAWPRRPLPNVWLGTSVEDQATYDRRAVDLKQTPAAVRFFSMEPLLNVISAPWLGDWVIVGGESGAGARPMHPDWARRLRDQCASANVPFFFKQWGEHTVVYDREVEDPDWRRCGDVERETPRGMWWNLAGGQGFHGERVVRVVPTTKKAAGRLLDGVTHDAMPGAGLMTSTTGGVA